VKGDSPTDNFLLWFLSLKVAVDARCWIEEELGDGRCVSIDIASQPLLQLAFFHVFSRSIQTVFQVT